MGTTVATNALLERTGERTLLVITRGFARRPADRLPEPSAHLRPPHRPARPAARRRSSPSTSGCSPTGRWRSRPTSTRWPPTSPAPAPTVSRRSPSSACTGTCTRRTNGPPPRWPRAAGFTEVAVSSEVSPLMRLVPRTDTTTVDAYLSPVLRRYVDAVCADLPGVRPLFMQSNGGLTAADSFRGKDAVLSGPAGGLVGMARCSALAGFDPGDRLRHGRHVHGRLPLRGSARAGLRHRGRGRAAARADAGHPHGRGRRRLRPALHRRPVPGRPRLGGRRPRSRVLPPRRAADRHRRERAARPDLRRALPRASSARAATSRWTPRPCAPRFAALAARIGAETGDPGAPGGGRRGLPAGRRGHDGDGGEEDLRAEGPRRHRATR